MSREIIQAIQAELAAIDCGQCDAEIPTFSSYCPFCGADRDVGYA